jgi:hypothetical protein
MVFGVMSNFVTFLSNLCLGLVKDTAGSDIIIVVAKKTQLLKLKTNLP